MEEISAFEEFFREAMQEQLQALSAEYPENRSLNVDFRKLEQFNPDLADELLLQPDNAIRAAEAAVENLRIPVASGKHLRAHCRFFHLPENRNVMVQDLGADQLEKLIKVEGIVTLSTDIKPVVKVASWECMHCGEITKTYPEKNLLKMPDFCKCGRRDFRHLEREDAFINMQSAQMQDLVEKLKGNAPTSHISLWLEDDLVNVISPGDKFIVTGILRKRPVKKDGKVSAVYEKMLEINHLEKLEKEFEALEITDQEVQQLIALSKRPDLFEQLIKSIAPSIYGHDEIKLAIALQLFGGNFGKVLPDGKKIRGEVHTLLIGDPGCLIADERIVLGNGAIMKLGSMGSSHLEKINAQILTGQGYRRDYATVFHAYPGQPTIEITTESGKSIKGTYNHPLLVVKNMRRTWKRLDQLKVGDRLASITWIPCTIKKPLALEWKKGERRFGPRFKGKLPNILDAPLAGLLGYIQGDGWVTKTAVAMDVIPEEGDLIPLLQKTIQEKFGMHAKVLTSYRPNKKPIHILSVHSVDIALNLQFLNEKRVPDVILQSGNAVAAEYLSWLFEADGTVFSKGRGRRAIQFHTSKARVEFLRDLQILLLRFGVHSRILGNEQLVIRRAESIRKFGEQIGFRSRKKKARLEQLLSDTKHLHHKHGKQLSERIVQISKAGTADVYDVEVPKSHRFIANGIISHNTSKSTLLLYVKNLAPKCIYVSGKGTSGVGLCVAPDSLVQFNDSGIEEIGKKIESRLENPMEDKTEPGAFFDEKKMRVAGLDAALRSGFMETQRIWKIRSPQRLIRVTTRRGKRVTITPNTPLLTMTAEGPAWITSKSLVKSAFVATSRRLPELNGKPIPTITLIGNQNATAELEKGELKQLTDALCRKHGMEVQALAEKYGMKRDRLYAWRLKKPRGVELQTAAQMALEAGLPLGVKTLSVRDGKRIRLPSTLDEGLFYLAGAMAADGDIYVAKGGMTAGLRLHSSSKEILMRVQKKLDEMGVHSKIQDDGKRVPCLRFGSVLLAEILGKMGVPAGEKSHLIDFPDFISASPLSKYFVRGLFDCDGYTAPAISGSPSIGLTTTSERMATKLQLWLEGREITARVRVRDKRGQKALIGKQVVETKRIQYQLEIRGKRNLLNFRERVGFDNPQKAKKLDRILKNLRGEWSNLDNIPLPTSLWERAAQNYGVPSGLAWTSHPRMSRKRIRNVIGKLPEESRERKILEAAASDDIYWDEIANKEEVPASSEWVYDFTLPSHAFFANGIAVHNTASAEKDEFGEGWVLKAGAMVLASGGQVNIDEVDKMEETDRVAMHEALESGQISIAKAGIVTTFKARTSVLAAANPKLGRFNPNEPPAAQFDLSPTLLSRFDLVFPIKDVLDEAKDRKLAEHILKGHKYAAEAGEITDPSIMPAVPLDVLRKYIAYARKNFSPIISAEASDKIKEFYLKLRKLGEKQNNYPVTARQIEGLIRLSEASAKARLSGAVEAQDAERAINLTEFVLETVFMDRDTGRIDSDIINIGQAKSRTDRARVILSIIQEKEKEVDMVAVEDVVREAEKAGIDDTATRRIIEELHRQTEIFRPKSGYVRTSQAKRV